MNNSKVTICVVLFCLAMGTIACKSKVEPPKQPRPSASSTQEKLKQVNKVLAEKDQETIAKFLKRRGWEMERTPSGLWIRFLEKDTSGQAVTDQALVRYCYHTRMLDGTLCYSSDEDGAKQVNMANAQIVPGLKEALLLLHKGDSAQFVLPPHLAYGLLGDQKRIPARAILFYEVRVTDVVP